MERGQQGKEVLPFCFAQPEHCIQCRAPQWQADGELLESPAEGAELVGDWSTS